jgi:hypothetical protein
MNKAAQSRRPSASSVESESLPLANLRASAATNEARALVKELAERYPRKHDTRIRQYGRHKTEAAYETATAAFLAELLSAYENNCRDKWLRCSLDKNRFKGEQVSFRMFDGVRKSWADAGLVHFRKGLAGRHRLRNPETSHSKLTRYRATPKLLKVCASQGVTPDNASKHFQFEDE